MKKYSTFLFDFDGTIINSNAHVIECFQYAFREALGIDIPTEKITPTFGATIEDAVSQLAPGHFDELMPVYRAHATAIGDSLLREVDGAYDTMHALQCLGAQIAIVTSKKEVNAIRQMKLFHLDEVCDLLVGPEKTSSHKPNPEPVFYALDALGANANDALMIGDSPHDILCGNNAGVDTAGVRFSAVNMDSILAAKPTIMISHLSELLDLAKSFSH